MPRPPTPSDPANLLPWPRDPPHGWPPDWPWPPEFPPSALGQKRCIENCMKQGGSLAACAIICAILDALPPLPPLPPNGAKPGGTGADSGVSGAIHAIDDDIIEELKDVAQRRERAITELQNAAKFREQGNNAAADEVTRNAERLHAEAREIEIEIRGKERAKRKAQPFR